MSDQHLCASERDLAGTGHQLAEGQRSAMLKIESWLKRADIILTREQFDAAAALALVQEVRNQTGPGSIGLAAGQALGFLQAGNRLATNNWQRTGKIGRNGIAAKQRFELVRNAMAMELVISGLPSPTLCLRGARIRGRPQ